MGVTLFLTKVFYISSIMSLTETQASLSHAVITFLFWFFSDTQPSFHPAPLINCCISADIISPAAGYAWEEQHRRLNPEEHGEGASKTILCRLLYLFFFSDFWRL